MPQVLSAGELHPFSGLDVAWLVETRAATRREHPFLVWEPFEGAIVAQKHPMLDEVPIAFVLPAAGAPQDLADHVATACVAQLADFKRPREIRMVDDFPRATLEKIAKAELRRRLAEEAK